MTTENLRREARVDVRVPVVVFRGKSTVALETSDVSFKGLFVRTTEPSPLRSLVRLKVALFDREFDAHAMVVHVVAPSQATPRPVTPPRDGEGHAPGMGLQFWGLSGPDRTAWDDFVRGLVHARRSGLPRPSAEHPAASEPATPSGVHILVTPARVSKK
jgi:hypothetical protein